MKTTPIFLFLLIVCFACAKNGGTLTDSQKEKVISEVKPVVDEMLKGVEEANINALTATSFDSPDYTYINGGKVYSYGEIMEATKPMFAILSNQKAAKISEKYAVLDNSTVIYTLVARWEMNFKDGHSVIQEPWVNQFTFKKIGGKWKTISVIESGYERPDKVSKEPKELDQIALATQFLGTWKWENSDTVVVYDQKPLGKNAQEVAYKTTVKGRLVDEGRQLVAYDPKLDRMVVLTATKDKNMWTGSIKFNSKNKYSCVFDGDTYHPESAINWIDGEITDSGQLVEKIMQGDKVMATYTYNKVK